MKREDNFIAGAGISISPSDNTTTGQRDITLSTTAVVQTAEANLSQVNIGAFQAIGNIVLTVGTGQKARLWYYVWVSTNDASGHLVKFDLTGGGLALGNQNRVQVTLGVGITGTTGADATVAWEGSDTTVGTNTYTVAVTKVDSNAVSGQLVTIGGKLMGDVVSV